MSTSTVISNMALSHNKCTNIASIDDANKEARTCKQFYDVALKYMLEEHPYGFAERRVALALASGVDPSTYSAYTYAYEYPADCLVAGEIYNSASASSTDEIPFILGTNAAKDATYILTNQVDAYLIYTASTDSFTTMRSSTFQLALSFMLAWLIAVPLGAGEASADRNRNYAFGISAQSKNKDSNEQYEDLEDFNQYADVMK